MQPSNCGLAVQDEEIVETLIRMLIAGDHLEAASLLKRCHVRFEQTDYDNWNGGTLTYTLFVQVSPETYTLLGERVETAKEEITAALKAAVKQLTDNWYAVEIVPLIVGLPGRPDLEGGPVSKRTRLAVITLLKQGSISWSGQLSDTEFLGKIFELDKLPSTDQRFSDAAGDIRQHRERNLDWEDDWLFQDPRFDLLDGEDAIFLAFTERLVDSAVRSAEEASSLVQKLNPELQRDGWSLEETQSLGDQNRFRISPWNPAYGRAASSLHKTALILSSTWMYQEINRIEASIDNDPALAIGTAKELIDTCCKHIAERLHLNLPANPDMPVLVKAVLKELKLVPEGISEEAKGYDIIKRTLSNLTHVTQGLAELRNLYGSGHGRSSKHRGLQPRHARLAVATAAAFAEFVVETYRKHVEDQKMLAGQSTSSSTAKH